MINFRSAVPIGPSTGSPTVWVYSAIHKAKECVLQTAAGRKVFQRPFSYPHFLTSTERFSRGHQTQRIAYYCRPQLSCGKVMFSLACVKNSVQRGGVSAPVHDGIHTPLGRQPPGRTPSPWQTASAADGMHPTGTGFPLGLENLENGKAFSSQGKVREF